jgi:hypothetical protein
VSVATACSKSLGFHPEELRALASVEDRSSRTTQSRRRTTPEGAAVAGTEVQGFRLERDLYHQTQTGVWAKGEASEAVRLCRRPPSLTTCRKGRATTRRGHHAMLAGAQNDPTRKASKPGPDVPVAGRKEPELKLSIRGRRPGLLSARST